VNQFYKNISLWLVISLMMILLFNMFNKPRTVAEKLNFSDFIAQIDSGKITAVTIQGNDIYGKYEGKDGKEFHTYKPASDADLTKKLLEKKVTIVAKPDEEKFSWFFHIHLLVPIHTSGRGLDFLHAPDAGGRRQGHVFRQEPR